MYFGRLVALIDFSGFVGSCICSFIVLPYALADTYWGRRNVAWVAYDYPGSCAPSRWLPSALKQNLGRGPFGLAHRVSRASPMRAASGCLHLQFRIIPQYVSDFQPRTMILSPGTRNILPTKIKQKFRYSPRNDKFGSNRIFSPPLPSFKPWEPSYGISSRDFPLTHNMHKETPSHPVPQSASRARTRPPPEAVRRFHAPLCSSP